MVTREGFLVRIKRWASLAIAAGTVAGVTALPVTTAQAAVTAYSVQVGGDTAVSGVGFEGMRFLAPQTFAVHKGDSITFTMAGFHTATLLPDDQQNPDTWRAQHQAGLSSDYSLIVPDSDDGATQFEFNNAGALPSDPQCGTETTACGYDGKTVVNSGAFASTFTVTIDDNPGASIWVICLIHPDMQMHIQVVPDATTSTTQAEVDSYKTSTLAADHEGAAALIPKLEKPTHHKTSSGAVVWDAYAGFDQDGYGLDGMFPSTMHIKKGQTVRWHFSQLMGNIHTVTFPKSQAVSLSGQFGVPACEADPADTPPTSPNPPFCTDPTTLELHVPGAALLPAGSHSYAGSTSGLRSSGVEGVGAPSMAPYDLKFTHLSNKKGFRYACIIHGGMMSGTVIVS
jgi:plastocyanin